MKNQKPTVEKLQQVASYLHSLEWSQVAKALLAESFGTRDDVLQYINARCPLLEEDWDFIRNILDDGRSF